MPHSGTRFRIITLGRCAILSTQGAPGDAPVFGPGKPFALLAFLACAPRRNASREALLDLLWSDSDSGRARNALRQLVWLVRSRLGDEILVSEGDLLTLSPSIVADRDEFLAAAAIGDSAGAVERYGGPFLPDLATPGSAEFEHWADVERQHLHATYARAAEIRVRELMDLGRTGEGVELARVLRDRDPLREGSWRLLLEALLADRNLLSAAAEADALARMFR
jgi:DNA-binding SARP family transcriptional activator